LEYSAYTELDREGEKSTVAN